LDLYRARSASGQKRKWLSRNDKSALPSRADIVGQIGHV
jgi:hypothetical protein